MAVCFFFDFAPILAALFRRFCHGTLGFARFTVPGSPDPRSPRPTLRWGQAQGTWSFWALPFVGRWLAAKLLGREDGAVGGESERREEVIDNASRAKSAAWLGSCQFFVVFKFICNDKLLPFIALTRLARRAWRGEFAVAGCLPGLSHLGQQFACVRSKESPPGRSARPRTS